MKRVTAVTSEDGITHIEAPGCVINIHAGLTNRQGQVVTAITIRCDQHVGEPVWVLPDFNDVKYLNVRVMREDTTPG